MGFLNSKERIFDTILTQEGKRQLAQGTLSANYYSFTDLGSFYSQEMAVSGANDATKRIYLEAGSSPQDTITFESNDAGQLVSFPGSDMVIRNGKILVLVTGSAGDSLGKVYEPAQDNIFSSMVSNLLSGSLEAFRKSYIIGSPSLLDDSTDDAMALRPGVARFRVTNDSPIRSTEIQTGNIDETDGLFLDSRLSHIPNFQYLPPINKYRPGDSTVFLLGNYPPLNQKPQLTFTDVENEMAWAVERGYEVTVSIENSSPHKNNLICQLFELGSNQIIKLDVIDFGLFTLTGNELSQEQRKNSNINLATSTGITKHIFFAGKVFTDSAGVNKFINMFTIIFEG